MADEPIFCGGTLEDGSTCKRCRWTAFYTGRGAFPDIVPGYWSDGSARERRFCPECGTKLGVTKDGQPTTEAMVPSKSVRKLLLDIQAQVGALQFVTLPADSAELYERLTGERVEKDA